MTTYTIRSVDTTRPDVCHDLMRLQAECLPNDVPCSIIAGHWWIAYQADTPVAFAGMVASQRWSDTGYLCRAGVVPAHRGRGLQKRLIAVRMNKARRLGWKWLITDTRDNPASANSLISAGFRMYQPRDPWGWDDAVYWRRKL